MHSHAVKILLFSFIICTPFSTQVIAYGEDGSYASVYNTYLNTTVTDLDNDLMRIEFYWGNYTAGEYFMLEKFENVTTGTQLSVFLPNYFERDIYANGVTYPVKCLEHNMRYEWFIFGYDGKNATLVQNWFYTCKAWDLNLDKITNYLDLSLAVSHYNENLLSPGAEPWDINEDSYIDYLDISIVVNHYGENN